MNTHVAQVFVPHRISSEDFLETSRQISRTLIHECVRHDNYNCDCVKVGYFHALDFLKEYLN